MAVLKAARRRAIYIDAKKSVVPPQSMLGMYFLSAETPIERIQRRDRQTKNRAPFASWRSQPHRDRRSISGSDRTDTHSRSEHLGGRGSCRTRLLAVLFDR